MRDKGNHQCLSEGWLLDNLPDGWSYDCVLDGTYGDGQDGFVIYPPRPYRASAPLFIPLDLLVRDRRWRRDRQS